jgi:very-short-patch-repair endonuclease
MTKETRQKIRQAYKNWKPRSSPYKYFDWMKILTPIEYNIWQDIRNQCEFFYPQFPVGPYFIDFADPVNKIGIEVDSAKWHSSPESQKSDKLRETALNSMGWSISRIWGRDTFVDVDISNLVSGATYKTKYVKTQF